MKLSIKEAANFLGVAISILRRWDKEGKLVPERTVGGHRRYSATCCDMSATCCNFKRIA
ncbi:excisionase family DNA binding protein [Halanaerobacter jeridensis]|uniref:Excisionase family DNA binding protein n=1 Tax=Halanaerobacter jeridensis TaxID=706427 RepID=A0A939BN09_9FIRM|nr:helix-turn-helix domain-containing protein [Halanaerobacter jeridensis]MBM7557915.1 excisionase family DNA binding protein [Halanaerobacter jeridensis]